ncbi:unnamed protein product [Pedinophyceae sp. YPF-701]|nr:unnamed protein product [Pedinophyceae sp. YPF-701]
MSLAASSLVSRCAPRHAAARGRRIVARAEAVEIPSKFSTVRPKGDLVLVKIGEVEEKTKGGILLPASVQSRPTSGDVVALGDGNTPMGKQELYLKEGQTVLFGRFGIGATDLEIQGEPHVLIREDDCIGVMPKSNATMDELPQMKPIGDRVLLRVIDTADTTIGGVVLAGAKERPVQGVVLAVGPGKMGPDGERKKVALAEGDNVLYFKYAGDPLEAQDGTKYIVLHESDVLCKV